MQPQNIEGVVISYLKTVAGVPTQVGTKVPNPRPAEFVRVQRVDGGYPRNMIQERPTVLLECWGATDSAAWDLAALCYGAFAGRTPLEHNGVELEERIVSSPVNYPDPSTASPRYTFTLTTTVTLEGSTS